MWTFSSHVVGEVLRFVGLEDRVRRQRQRGIDGDAGGCFIVSAAPSLVSSCTIYFDEAALHSAAEKLLLIVICVQQVT